MRSPCTQPVLLITLLLLVTAVSHGDCGVEAESFRKLSLQGRLASCRILALLPTRYLPQCLVHWTLLTRQQTKPRFVTHDTSSEAGSCEISAWCDELFVSEMDAHTALLPVSLGQPRLVLFAVKSGSQLKVLDSFLTPIGCNQSLLVSPAVGPTPIDFWRSCWLDRLPDLMRLLSGKTLSMEILKDGATVLKISFDASYAGLNLTNWFGKDRLVGSEPDLAMASRDFNFFSVFGDTTTVYCYRTFFINLVYNGCPGDAGILTVIERVDTCSWAQTGSGSTALPRILYNLNPGQLWDNAVRSGDYLLVTAA